MLTSLECLLFIFYLTHLESRQYNIDYLIDLVNTGDQEGAEIFFSNPNLMKKTEYVIELQ